MRTLWWWLACVALQGVGCAQNSQFQIGYFTNGILEGGRLSNGLEVAYQYDRWMVQAAYDLLSAYGHHFCLGYNSQLNMDGQISVCLGWAWGAGTPMGLIQYRQIIGNTPLAYSIGLIAWQNDQLTVTTFRASLGLVFPAALTFEERAAPLPRDR